MNIENHSKRNKPTNLTCFVILVKQISVSSCSIKYYFTALKTEKESSERQCRENI